MRSAFVSVGVCAAACLLTLPREASAFFMHARCQTRRMVCSTDRQSTAIAAGRAPTADTPVASDAALELKQKLRALCANKSEVDRETRIEQLAKELNALSPIKDPALSPLLAGNYRLPTCEVLSNPNDASCKTIPRKWRMLHSTVPGPSSGRLGPFVGDVWQDVRPEDKRIVNMLELGPSWALRGALEADVEVLDGQNWAIVFDMVYNSFAGIRVQEKKFDRAVMERRIWNMTYLDQDFRILYGRQEGLPVEDGFIFVMERDVGGV